MGAIFDMLMKRNKPIADAFMANPEFRKFLIGLYMAAGEQADEWGCNLEDIEIVEARMTADGYYTFFKMAQSEESKLQKKSALVNPITGKPFEVN